MFTGEFIIKEIQPNNTYKVNIKEDSEYVEFEIDKRYIVRPTKNQSLKDTTYEVFLAGERYPRYVTQKCMRKLFEYVKGKEHLTMEWKHDKTRGHVQNQMAQMRRKFK
jgi:ribonuclease HI